jgi:hypothetical protein
MHGYDPAVNKEMNGIFYAYGYGVIHKSIDTVHQLDIVPTIANLLRMQVPDYIEGNIINLN